MLMKLAYGAGFVVGTVEAKVESLTGQSGVHYRKGRSDALIRSDTRLLAKAQKVRDEVAALRKQHVEGGGR